MHNITVLALSFAVCLATIIVVVAIPVGITIAEALRMGWHISGQAFIFVLAGAVGVYFARNSSRCSVAPNISFHRTRCARR